MQSFATGEAAERWLRLLDAVGPAQAVAALEQPEASTAPTVGELVFAHIEHLTGITEGTRQDYNRMAARHIVPHVGALPVTMLDRQAGARWLNALTRTGMAASTIRNHHSLLSAALTQAVWDKEIPENVVKGLRMPSTLTTQEMVFLTRDEYMHLRECAPERWRPLVTVLAETGMRWGEATALTISDLDFDRRTVRIRQAWKRSGKAQPDLGVTKGRQSRTVAMPKRARDDLRELSGRAPREFLFINSKGGPVRHSPFRLNVWVPTVATFAGDKPTGRHPTTRRMMWDGQGTGERPRIHDLRHSFASWAIARGMSLTSIQRHMGHQSIKTTSDTYGHIFRADLDQFAEIVPDIVEGDLLTLDP
ncbi:tyrosine-type recombinase/integrase [Ornithinimicrobium sp. LYQ92]|uniref:tyrosine-type recombinase/integrase n=1 Tax=Serinicoccus sp. LYQ92 TaxID=3378798 RepID=UPI003854CD95